MKHLPPIGVVRRKRTSYPVADEVGEQVVLAQWLDLVGVLWCHVPNGGLRAWATARAMHSAGVKAGVPDVLIFTPPPKRPGDRGTALELKREAGGQLSAAQRDWLAGLSAAGWSTAVKQGAGAAIAWLTELGYGPGPG